jgi:serine/threonine-protein kinase HipA
MNKARVSVNRVFAGVLAELDNDKYSFTYEEKYNGPPVSLTMPIIKKKYDYDKFPSFFEGLLPEGEMLQPLLLKYKLDKKDYVSQLLKVGQDVVGAVSIEGIE